MQILLTWTGLSIAMMVTDTLLLSTLGVRYLPIALLLTSAFTLSSSLGYTALLGRYQSAQLLQASLTLSGSLLLAAFAGLKLGANWLCLPLLAFYGASFSMLATQSFGLASECIDTYSSKRLFPLLTVGATCGELLGGLLVAGGARWLDPAGWVLVWSGFHWLALLWLQAHRRPVQDWRQGEVGGRLQRQGAVLKYLRKAPMALSLTMLLLGMVLCQGTSQYLYSQVFSRSFPDSRDLARFLGQLMALTNLAELVIATQATPRLVHWLGVARAGWIHPLLMLSGLTMLSFHFSLGPAIWLWICRRTLQDSLATPVRNLLYNAIPARVRGHLRAFLDGLVFACAQSGVALLLMALQHSWSVERIVYAGIFLGLLYLIGAAAASRNYLQTLVVELKSQSLNLKQTAPVQTGMQVNSEQAPASLRLLEQQLDTTFAMSALAVHPDPLALQILARGLALPRPTTRHQTAELLATRREAGVRAALPFLFSDQADTVEAAFQVLGSSQTAWGRSLLQGQLASRTRAAARAWVTSYLLQAESLSQSFLKQALLQESQRHQRLAFRVLHWLEGEDLMHTLRLSVLAQGGRRASALEVLSNLGDRQVAQLFVTLLEPNQDEDRARLLQEAAGQKQLMDPSLSDDPWVRWAAVRARQPGRAWELGKMQQLLRLRQTPPFHRLDFDQLEKVRLRMIEMRWAEARTVWRVGDQLSYGLVPLQEELEARFHGGVELAGNLPARSDFTIPGATRVLALAASEWQRLLIELPALALGTFQWLNGELRRAESCE
ncbi:hypothetical protein JST97_04900 [bacterium]|nr:hypothetical protein [bacterium]